MNEILLFYLKMNISIKQKVIKIFCKLALQMIVFICFARRIFFDSLKATGQLHVYLIIQAYIIYTIETVIYLLDII